MPRILRQRFLPGGDALVSGLVPSDVLGCRFKTEFLLQSGYRQRWVERLDQEMPGVGMVADEHSTRIGL